MREITEHLKERAEIKKGLARINGIFKLLDQLVADGSPYNALQQKQEKAKTMYAWCERLPKPANMCLSGSMEMEG